MTNEWQRGPMADYINDRTRWSGSTLRMEPERLGQWLDGTSVDYPTAAKAQGSLTHLFALGQGSGEISDFAFYPNRNEALTEEKVLQVGPKGGKAKLVPTGRFVPQDASDAGRYKPAIKMSNYEKAQHREWMEAHRGKTIVYPETQPVIHAMAKAIRNDPHAAALLHGPGYEPEVTGHWASTETLEGRFPGAAGQLCRVRLDGLRIDEDIVIELKTISPGKFGRLDTSNPGAVMRWAKDGYAVKGATCHDAFRAITGRNCTVVWILCEAVADHPRVSVVYDEAGSTMHEIGREGFEKAGIKGYIELIELASKMRESRDFRHPTVREPQAKWAFPEYVEDALCELTGMTEVDDGAGQ